MNSYLWWQAASPELQAGLSQIWIPVGTPGHTGDKKAHWEQHLDTRFGQGGWRIGHYVRGQILPVTEALREYEQGYRTHLYRHPEIVEFLVKYCGNVYDDNISNVYDDSYHQPHTHLNHYQDISVRRVISELVDDPDWPAVAPTRLWRSLALLRPKEQSRCKGQPMR